MNKYYAFYGSLRKGHYNFTRCFTDLDGNLKDGVEYLGTYNLEDQPFKMISLGPFPMLFQEDKLHPLTVDVVKIENQKIREFVDMMELGAGYTKTEIEVPVKSDTVIACTLYVGSDYDLTYYKDRPVISSGNWDDGVNARGSTLNGQK